MQKQSLQFPPRKSLRLLAILFLLSTLCFCFERQGKAQGSTASGQQASSATDDSRVWLVVKVSERRLELVGDYSYRMDGAGQVNFKDGGRVVELPEGLTIMVNDEKVGAERRVLEGETVRVVDSKGETVWKLSAVRGKEMSW